MNWGQSNLPPTRFLENGGSGTPILTFASEFEKPSLKQNKRRKHQ
jgi:hypothetical protein